MATDTSPPSKPSFGPPTTVPLAPAVDVWPPSATPPTLSTSVSPPPTVFPRPTEPESDVIHLPSYARWFSWNSIHECEARFVPEFFDGRSSSRNPRVYKYYRNAIIRLFRESPNRKITFTEVRKIIVGDVGSIRRAFDFLEAWGLINYTVSTSKPQLKWEDKEARSAAASGQGSDTAAGAGTDAAVPKKRRICTGCKASCTIACFASDKHDITLCARCYVRGNYRVGVSCSDFKRVEISDESKSDWTDKETLQLLEAVIHYGDDWKKVAEHVGGRSGKECVARFIKLPFGKQFDGPPESTGLETGLSSNNVTDPNKRMRLSPLGDASNPIMAQAAFLSTLVGVDVAEVTAHAAVKALSDLGDKKQLDSDSSANMKTTEGALGEAKLQLEREEDELEKAVFGIATQTKEIGEKMHYLEEFELQMERERQHFEQLQNRLLVDQLTLIFQNTAIPRIWGEHRKSER